MISLLVLKIFYEDAMVITFSSESWCLLTIEMVCVCVCVCSVCFCAFSLDILWLNCLNVYLTEAADIKQRCYDLAPQ